MIGDNGTTAATPSPQRISSLEPASKKPAGAARGGERRAARGRRADASGDHPRRVPRRCETRRTSAKMGTGREESSPRPAGRNAGLNASHRRAHDRNSRGLLCQPPSRPALAFGVTKARHFRMAAALQRNYFEARPFKARCEALSWEWIDGRDRWPPKSPDRQLRVFPHDLLVELLGRHPRSASTLLFH